MCSPLTIEEQKTGEVWMYESTHEVNMCVPYSIYYTMVRYFCQLTDRFRGCYDNVQADSSGLHVVYGLH